MQLGAKRPKAKAVAKAKAKVQTAGGKQKTRPQKYALRICPKTLCACVGVFMFAYVCMYVLPMLEQALCAQ